MVGVGILNKRTSRSANFSQRERNLPESGLTIEETLLGRRNKSVVSGHPEDLSVDLPDEMDLTVHKNQAGFRKRRRPHHLMQSNSVNPDCYLHSFVSCHTHLQAATFKNWKNRIKASKQTPEQFYATYGIDPTGGDLMSSVTVPSSINRPFWDNNPQDQKVLALEARCEELTSRLKQMEQLMANAGEKS